MSTIQFAGYLDARGMFCPQPVLRTKKALDAIDKDQVLKVETTDPASKSDLAAWTTRTGNELLKVEERSGTLTFFIRKKV